MEYLLCVVVISGLAQHQVNIYTSQDFYQLRYQTVFLALFFVFRSRCKTVSQFSVGGRTSLAIRVFMK